MYTQLTVHKINSDTTSSKSKQGFICHNVHISLLLSFLSLFKDRHSRDEQNICFSHNREEYNSYDSVFKSFNVPMTSDNFSLWTFALVTHQVYGLARRLPSGHPWTFNSRVSKQQPSWITHIWGKLPTLQPLQLTAQSPPIVIALHPARFKVSLAKCFHAPLASIKK